MEDAVTPYASKVVSTGLGRMRSVFDILQNLSIQIKASAASAVLLTCLLALGANTYVTSTKTAEGLRTLSHEVEPKLQVFSELSDDIVATHIKICQRRSKNRPAWRSNKTRTPYCRSTHSTPSAESKQPASLRK